MAALEHDGGRVRELVVRGRDGEERVPCDLVISKPGGLTTSEVLAKGRPLLVIEELDMLLVMTVNPGFGGQRFIPYTLRKIAQARELLDARNPACELEIDGGVDLATIGPAYALGAILIVLVLAAISLANRIMGRTMSQMFRMM